MVSLKMSHIKQKYNRQPPEKREKIAFVAVCWPRALLVRQCPALSSSSACVFAIFFSEIACRIILKFGMEILSTMKVQMTRQQSEFEWKLKPKTINAQKDTGVITSKRCYNNVVSTIRLMELVYFCRQLKKTKTQ